jgi:putative addiction module antidote
MIKKVTLRRIGGSLGTTLPKDMVDRFHACAGDQMFAIETEDGILLTPYDPTFDKAMKLYARFSRKYRNALRELAQ